MLDVLSIDTLGELDYAEAAEASRRIFSERGTHELPPKVAIPGEWGAELGALAQELDFPIRTASAIELRFREVVGNLDRAGEPR